MNVLLERLSSWRERRRERSLRKRRKPRPVAGTMVIERGWR